ncbi:malonic semialdehyde reductase [Zavarzinia sp. CC-PAN008]|uniref:malonic semialdehyde reductase n=1 Tax=Zavarzinia sp. CC-PAN008 TaxID=3243332 RepID=UPI003F747CDB
MTKAPLDDASLDLLFREARTFNGFIDKPVADETLKQLWDLVKWGPTSANAQPVRFLFLKSPEAKERLKPALSSGNLAKTMSAPVTVIVAHDLRFYENLEKWFPHDKTARYWFEGKEEVVQATAFRNGTLQGAYFILAARALGLDTGAMSGFDNAKVDAEFFPDGRYKSNFLINLGYGDPTSLFGRSPRPEFEDSNEIL